MPVDFPLLVWSRAHIESRRTHMEETSGSQISRAVGKKLNESLYQTFILSLPVSKHSLLWFDWFLLFKLCWKYTISAQFRDLQLGMGYFMALLILCFHPAFLPSWLRLAKGVWLLLLMGERSSSHKAGFCCFLASSHDFFFDNSAIPCDIAIKWLSYLRVGIYKSAKVPALCLAALMCRRF